MQHKDHVDRRIQSIIDRADHDFVRVTDPDGWYQRFVSDRYYNVPNEFIEPMVQNAGELSDLADDLRRCGHDNAARQVRSAGRTIEDALYEIIDPKEAPP